MLAKLPAQFRSQTEAYAELQDRLSGRVRTLDASPTIAGHALIVMVLGLMGEGSGFGFSE